MQAQDYWNQIGSGKEFEDPLYLERLSHYLTLDSKILEYGCGYGRLLQILKSNGYSNLIGLDFAQNMISRGKNLNPDLDMRLIDNSVIPFANESMDAIIMSTVLCCILDDSKQKELTGELSRVLKTKGILYLSDFLISDNPRYSEKYVEGFEKFHVRGVYTTNEGLVVRHLTSSNVMKLLEGFDIQWFEQFDFKTMNNNPARTFHCIAQKK